MFNSYVKLPEGTAKFPFFVLNHDMDLVHGRHVWLVHIDISDLWIICHKSLGRPKGKLT